MSSTEYAELAGLRIALSNINIAQDRLRDDEWFHATNWMHKRIKELTGK